MYIVFIQFAILFFGSYTVIKKPAGVSINKSNEYQQHYFCQRPNPNS